MVVQSIVSVLWLMCELELEKNIIKNKIYKQGIGIAEKAKKQEGIVGVI